MKLTSRSRYAVTAMLDLALHGKDRPVCVSAVAARQNISPAYLERLFRHLRERGLICSTRGARGGYRLCRRAECISVAEVMAAVGEPLDVTACGGGEDCRVDGARCLTHDLWADLTRHVRVYLARVSLEDLCARHRGRTVAVDAAPVEFFPPSAERLTDHEHDLLRP